MLVRDLPTAIDAAAQDYFRLVLVVGPADSGKSSRLREFSGVRGYPLLLVGRPVAGSLLELPERQRFEDYIRHPVPDDIVVPEIY